jgi:hypothetical protein
MTADAAKLDLDRQEWRKKRQKEADFLQDQRHALQWKLGKLETDLVAFAAKDRDLQVRESHDISSSTSIALIFYLVSIGVPSYHDAPVMLLRRACVTWRLAPRLTIRVLRHSMSVRYVFLTCLRLYPSRCETGVYSFVSFFENLARHKSKPSWMRFHSASKPCTSNSSVRQCSDANLKGANLKGLLVNVCCGCGRHFVKTGFHHTMP